MATEEKKTCFVIMPFSDVEGYDKGHFTRVYEHLIKPACKQAGFEPQRADETPRTDVIMVDILKKIIACDIAICDLSSRNANVFYELGLRHAFNKKTILIKDYKTPMPFDISGIRTLAYNESLRIDEVQKIIPEIAKYLKETNDADEKEANSMLQMLSIDDPATLPKKTTLGTDSRMILNAIDQISQQLSIIMNDRDFFNRYEINNQFTRMPSIDNSFISTLAQIYDQQPSSPYQKTNNGQRVLAKNLQKRPAKI